MELTSEKKEEKTKKDAKNESEVHYGVTCDACDKQPIVGNRYKCEVCEDFDICGHCEDAGEHPGHNMKRIASTNELIKRYNKS